MKLILLTFSLMLFLMSSISAQTAPPIDVGVSRELAKWRAENYSNVRYGLNLTLEKMSPTLKGSIEIRVDVKKDAGQIILDWRQIRGKEELTTVSNVQINGVSAKFVEQNEHLIFRENVVAGENLIKLDFTSPIATSGAAVTRYVDKEDGAEYIYSLFVPSDASTAFPVFDQPDLKALFYLEIIAPNDWKVISNANGLIWNGGFIDGRTFPKETSFHTFTSRKPISTYVFAFSAGEFKQFVDETNRAKRDEFYNELDKNGAAIKPNTEFSVFNPPFEAAESRIFVRKSQAEKFKPHEKEIFRLNREAVKYLETYFDYKFPFPKYDLVLIPEFPFGGMEHAGATFLRESSIIFPSEPTANDYISRGNLIFHEAAHQWFGDTVTMRWFDDLWLKEGFAEFMAYKTMEKVLPQYNAWKAFYERNKPLAYQTDSTKGTTAIYQEIPNLNAAKSAYGNIVYRKAPSFLKQAEFYLGEKQFQTAVRSFLKQNAFKNAEWQDLVNAFEKVDKTLMQGKDLTNAWIKMRGLWKIRLIKEDQTQNGVQYLFARQASSVAQLNPQQPPESLMKFKILIVNKDGTKQIQDFNLYPLRISHRDVIALPKNAAYVFPNYQDYGYGIFLLDDESRNYILANIHNEKDDFLRSMMWGALWDSMREAELNPRDYVELAIKNIGTETDELTIQTILNRVSTAMNYYIADKSEPSAVADGTRLTNEQRSSASRPSATADGSDLSGRLEKVLLERMTNSATLGQRIVFYRALVNFAATDDAKRTLKNVLGAKTAIKGLTLKTKDKFDIVTRLLIVNDADAPNLLAELEKTETSDDAKRYAYAARAAIATAANKQKFFNDFVAGKDISESWIESAFVPFNAVRQADLTAPFLEKALRELPNLKRNRKIFFVNGWLAAFIGGQRSAESLAVVNKFLADSPNLDKDLRLKILETADGLERGLRIRQRFSGSGVGVR